MICFGRNVLHEPEIGPLLKFVQYIDCLQIVRLQILSAGILPIDLDVARHYYSSYYVEQSWKLAAISSGAGRRWCVQASSWQLAAADFTSKHGRKEC